MFKTWFGLTLDAVLLGFETQRVMGLRLAKIAAGGPAAQVEAQRMVMEKNGGLWPKRRRHWRPVAPRRRSFAVTAPTSRRMSGACRG
jgi:hypothetical protein